jgi:dephospho-CoA kinase
MDSLRWRPLVVAGLTGGIASGKSTFARALASEGAVVISADDLGREVVAPGEPALAEIVAHFGRSYLLADGTLDRRALAERVFGCAADLAALNRITHPRIRRRLEGRVREAQRRPPASRVVVVEAAILIEAGWQTAVDRVIVVTVQPSTQVRRLTAGFGLTEEAARARLAAQLSDAGRLRHADFRVDGEGSPVETAEQAAALMSALRRLAEQS